MVALMRGCSTAAPMATVTRRVEMNEVTSMLARRIVDLGMECESCLSCKEACYDRVGLEGRPLFVRSGAQRWWEFCLEQDPRYLLIAFPIV